MSQNLLTISQKDFERKISQMSDKSLVSLLRNIYDFKWDCGKRFSQEQMQDIERKETKINNALMQRGYLDQKDYKDYFEYLRKINFKKRIF